MARCVSGFRRVTCNSAFPLAAVAEVAVVIDVLA